MPKKEVVIINTGGRVQQCLIALDMARQGYYLSWVYGNALHFWPDN